MTQSQQILDHLKSGKTITGLQALRKYGVGHLPRRILDLKQSGHSIQSQFVRVEKANGGMTSVKEYRLAV